MIVPSEKAPPQGVREFISNESPGGRADGDQIAANAAAFLTRDAAAERYRVLLDAMDQGFCVIEMLFDEAGAPNDYRFLEINALFEEQTGLANVVGKRIREFVPHHEQHWFDIYGGVALTGVPVRFENSSVGLSRWFSVYAFRDGGPESRRVAVMFSDVSGRKRSEFLTGLSRQLAVVQSENEIIAVTVDAVGRHLNVDRCYFVECLEPQNLVVLSRNWVRGATRSLEGRYNLYDFGGIEWWRSYCTGNFSVEDVETNPLTREKLGNYTSLGIRSYAVQPFRTDGEWTVILGVTEVIARKWTLEDLRLLDDVAARVWPLVQRARVDRALRESEAFLKSVIGATADCIKVLDLEGRIKWMSDNGLRLLEIADFAKVENTFWPDFCPDVPVRQLAWSAVQAAQAGDIGRFRGFCPTFGGTSKWWDVIVSPINGAEGKPVRILSVARDVTSVREVEEALRQSQSAIEDHAQMLEARVEELRLAKAASEMAGRHVAESAERFRLLSEVVSLQFWTADAEGGLDYVNQECVEYLGGDLNRDILGGSWKQYVHADDLSGAMNSWQHSVATGQRYEVKFRLRGKSGSYRWFLVRAEALRNAEGRIVKWFGSNTDIDELKIAQTAVERVSRAKDDFLAALSHELRTPLTPVLMTASALRDDDRLPADVREQLGMMERNIELEARLIDDLLDLTTISHGKLQLRTQKCEAHALLDLALEIVRDEARAKQIAVERRYRAERSWLQADPARFQQVAWNLLRNAVKFTPSAGRISIVTSNHVSADGVDWIHIEVTDTGIGINPVRLEDIFKPFEQEHVEGAHRFGGLGLGLAIARAVVDLHGGRIRAESPGPGRGATFVVELPLSIVPSAVMPEVATPGLESARKLAGDRKPAAAVDSQRPLRLLLVEDDASSLETLARLLKRDGYAVVATGNVADALAAAAAHEFDLVISDIGLPDGTGIALMEELRRRYGLRGVALSGYGMEEDVVRTRNAGFVTHLIKPIQIAELRRVLVGLGAAVRPAPSD